MLLILLLLLGLVAGILAGLFGVGGGILFTPILFFIFSGAGIEDPVTWTVGTSLFCTFTAALSSSVQQVREHNLFLIQGLRVGLFGAAGVYLGKQVVVSAFYTESVFVLFFVLLLMFMSIMLYLRSRKGEMGITGIPADEMKNTGSEGLNTADELKNSGDEGQNTADEMKRSGTGGLSAVSGIEPAGEEITISWKRATFTGGFGGFIAALAGVGGGIVMVPIMNLLYRVDIRRSVSISSFAIVIISLSGWMQFALLSSGLSGVSEWTAGFVDFGTALPLLGGAVAGGYAGVRINHKLKESYVQTGFSILVLVVMALMISRLF